MNVTQPAASAMLRRLRQHFGDPLLERVNNRYELTPLALQLREQVGPTLQLADRLFATRSQFDPLSDPREFTIAMSDYTLAVLGPPLRAAFAASAPHATLRYVHISAIITRSDWSGARSVDGIIMPYGVFPLNMPSAALFTDEWVALVDKDNPIATQRLEIEDLPHLSWVSGPAQPQEHILPLRQLAQAGIQLQPTVIAHSFLTLPLHIVGTDQITLIQRRLTEAVPLSRDLRILPCPFEASPIKMALWWHPAHIPDAGHQWLRSLVGDAAQRLK